MNVKKYTNVFTRKRFQQYNFTRIFSDIIEYLYHVIFSLNFVNLSKFLDFTKLPSDNMNMASTSSREFTRLIPASLSSKNTVFVDSASASIELVTIVV